VVALTFDDGPHPYPSFTPRVVDALALAKVKATFFCVGSALERHPEIAVTLSEQGHSLQNHTHSHDTGRDLFSGRRLADDVGRAQALLQQLTGVRPKYYRPAVGLRTPAVHHAAKTHQLEVVTWSLAARDGAFALTQRKAMSLAARARAGDIIVLHDGTLEGRDSLRAATLRELPIFLRALVDAGFGFVTLDELLASPS
jgi:peptidoglycan-N-acetylglucosamine deacetylase